MFVKVFEQIFSSSIMEEDLETRYIWFCFLALADREGFIDMTIPAIARRINVSETAVSNSIQKFMAIDASSRTDTHEGRRLEKVRDTFGWRIVNYVHYRDLQTEASRREYMREYMRTKRNVNKKVNVNVNSKHVLAVLGHTDTDTDLNTEKKRNVKTPSKNTEIPDWIPKNEWNQFLEMRKKIKKTPTEHAKELLIKDLENLKDKGHAPIDVLNQSIKFNWQGLFEIKREDNNGTGKTFKPRQPTPEEQAEIDRYAALSTKEQKKEDDKSLITYAIEQAKKERGWRD